MDIELLEIRDFIAAQLPFDLLPADAQNLLATKAEIQYLKRGTRLEDIDQSLVLIRTGALDLRDPTGELYDRLGEGDLLALACTAEGLTDWPSCTAAEDSLLYRLPREAVGALRASQPSFDRHFALSLHQRVQRIREQHARPQEAGLGGVGTAIGELIGKPPVAVAPETSIRKTAKSMTKHDVSSALVMHGQQLLGLVTDRDLRRRCVAAGLSLSTPVSAIMSDSVHTLPHDASVIDAILTLSRHNIHHLPVVRDGQVLGTLTSTDLNHFQNVQSPWLITEIHQAGSLDELTGIMQRLPELQRQSSQAGIPGRQIGRLLSAAVDALTRRLLYLAEKTLGKPPADYVWLAAGSHAREELTAFSDQDSALLIANDAGETTDGYFEALSRFVSDGLNTCGFAYCPGNAMASNPEWRLSRRAWKKQFKTWITSPEPKALMLSSIFFDLRPLHGPEELYSSLQREVLDWTAKNRIFISYMAANALTHRPPLGFFRNFVLIHGGEHKDTLDLKHRGMVAITDIARLLALSEGLPETNTYRRLRAAQAAGAISAGMAESLRDALELFHNLRYLHQARQIRAGHPPDSYIRPADLSPLERQHLKDAFAIIKDMQSTLAQRYQTDRFA